MYAHDAMKAANKYMECSILEITRAVEVLTAACENLGNLSTRKKKLCAAAVLQLMHKARTYLRMAVCCIQLDSELLDLPNNDFGRCYHFPPKKSELILHSRTTTKRISR
jgi:hypothetical protein